MVRRIAIERDTSGKPARILFASYSFVPTVCLSYGLPAPTSEYRFHPTRKWRFDFAWPAEKVGLEINGGVFTAGRHVRGEALLKEYEKLNEAAAHGWRVLFVTPKQLGEAPTYELLRRALG
jgi:hypothetical protein